MRKPAIAVIGLLAGLPGAAIAAGPSQPSVITVGRIVERGQDVKGHGLILAEGLRYELSAARGFVIKADPTYKREIERTIAETNKHRVDEDHWVERGRALGATHLVAGRIRAGRESCIASMELIHLETRRSRTPKPVAYDCSEAALDDVAGDLAYELMGVRASRDRMRRTKRVAPPVSIVLHEDHSTKESAPPERIPTPAAPPPPEPPPVVEAPPPEPVRDHPPATSARPSLPRSAQSASAEGEYDLSDFPGLEKGEVYSIRSLADDVRIAAPIVTAMVLLIPIVFLVLIALLSGYRRSSALRVGRIGFGVSLVLVCLFAAATIFIEFVLRIPLRKHVSIVFLGSPVAAVLTWMILGKRFLAFSEFGIGKRAGQGIMLTAFFIVLLVVGSQFVLPVWTFAIATLAFFGVFRLSERLRMRRNQSRVLS